jgi:hypothetical protein
MSTITMQFGAVPRRDTRAAARKPRLRLTRRGRAVLTVAVLTPLVVSALLIALNGGGASASFEGADAAFQYVTVESGETLWQLAQEVAPRSDPREVIDQFVQFNQLGSPDVYAGQELAIPPQYAH